MSADWFSAGIALIFSVIFSGAEIVFISTNKLQLELLDREGSVAGKIMLYYAERATLFFVSTLLGGILSLISLVYFVVRGLHAIMPDPLTDNFTILILSLTACALLVILVVHLMPKCWAAIDPTNAMRWIAIPFTFCFIVLFPLSYSILFILRFIGRIIPVLKYPEDRPLFRSQHFHPNHALKKNTHDDHHLSEEIVNNALEFKSVKVRDCMIPRTEITAVEVSETIDRLRQAFVESGFSKIIIFRKNIDDIIGYCHSSALFTKPASIQEILIPIITAPETTPANELMMRFIQEKKNLAVVMDEFGGTSGIVSAEDIIEEIFGDVDNEPDEDNLVEQKLDEETFVFNARLEIDYLNDTYSLKLPTGDYDTLAGLILSHTENIPSPGEIIHVPPFHFLIVTAYSNRIGIVKMTREPAQNDDFEGPDEIG